jgi:hypothetical protein
LLLLQLLDPVLKLGDFGLYSLRRSAWDAPTPSMNRIDARAD